MSTPAASPIPQGFHSLTPYLVCKDAAAAIEFYKQAFGAVENARIRAGDKIIHACLRIGDSPLMLSEEVPEMGAFGPQHFGGTAVTVHLSVADADAAAARAVAAGAKLVMPVAEMFWGARYGVLTDPFGHSWSVATQVRDMSPEEVQRNLANQMCGQVKSA